MPAQLLADVLLLVHDDETGACLVDDDTLRRIAVESAAEQVLAGGTLYKHVTRWQGPRNRYTWRRTEGTIEHYARVLDGPTPPPGYDTIASWLVGQRAALPAGQDRDLAEVAGAADHLVATTLDELVRAGTHAARHSPRFGDRSGTVYEEADGAREDHLRHRLRVSLDDDAYDPRTAALLRIIKRAGIAEHAFDSAAGMELRGSGHRFYLDKTYSRDPGRIWGHVALWIVLSAALTLGFVWFAGLDL
ncbi:GPP34 family phosphoprotein [Georgenia sp. Z1491]|uniref:GPP34 family phosphoprotein n=1 Tax=Georgenia sp. Z1491 TaxID=3416707 RepID=UPI003CEF1C22